MLPLASSGREIVGANITFLVIDILAVILRFVAKWRGRQRFALEDALILLSVSVFIAYSSVQLHYTTSVAGSFEPAELTLAQVTAVLKYSYVLEILFGIIITSLKLSVLCWYRTIFAVHNFRKITSYVGLICIVWFLITLFIIAFQCNPVAAVWNLELAVTAKCIPFGGLLAGYEISNIFLDLVILALPVRMIWKLQLNLRRKIGISAVFALSGLVVISSILRIVYLYHPHDDQRISISAGLFWSVIELGTAILCVNLPTFRPLFPHKFMLGESLRSWFSRLPTIIPSKRSAGSQESNDESLGRKNSASQELITDTSNDLSFSGLKASKGSHLRRVENPDTYPLEGIQVQHGFEVERSF